MSIEFSEKVGVNFLILEGKNLLGRTVNQPVDIEFTPQKIGNIEFVCGINMLRGTVVVE